MLHLALGSGNVNTNKSKMLNILAIVRLLCDHRADVNAADRLGLCPIHYCAKTMNTEAAIYLLNHGSQINAYDKKDRTALYYTAVDSYPDFEFAKMLARGGGKLGKAKPPGLLRVANESQRKVRALVDWTRG
jgi:ankyrin repeat protein